ncbi:protein dpy-30 homolog [Drosophila montana]|uniref:protein dpy-30 homolog n=1 Tax=Drosophila montana TaxID=40370 RepID=UPI00313CB761
MPDNQLDDWDDTSKKTKKKRVMCCPKDLPKKPKPEPKIKPPKPVVCDPIEKPPKKPKEAVKPACERPPHYRSGSEQRAYLQQEVVPILMEGMLGLARDQPRDPISYLEKFWLKEQQKCDIPLPDDLL